jgi:ribosomal protein S9
MSDDFNMSMRKFLKQVGVTSQQAIEDAVREGGQAGQAYAVKATITIKELGMTHEVDGTIQGRDD